MDYIHGPTASFLVISREKYSQMTRCMVIIWATREIREQEVYLDLGKRDGHILWYDRVTRRLNQWADDEGKLIPHALVS